MDGALRLEFNAAVQVERGTATECACGGELEAVPDPLGLWWVCRDCGKAYK